MSVAEMTIVEWSMFGIREPTLDVIRLTQAERRTLARAADLLERVRDLRDGRVPEDWYAGDEDDADLCFGQDICRRLAEDGSIDAPRVT